MIEVHAMKNLCRQMGVCLTICLVLVLVQVLPVRSACIPGQLQSYFYGVLWGHKVKESCELRAYIDGILVGTTSANPGRLEEMNDRVEFALYLCGESSDVGETVEFRYVRSKREYQVNVGEGDPVFNGRVIEVGSFPEIQDAKLLLEATKKKVVIPTDEETTAEGEETTAEGEETTAEGEDDNDTGDVTPAAANPDVNNDGYIDSNDAAIVLHYILFPEDNGGEGKEVDLSYDINRDGVVNRDDVKEIYRFRQQ